MYQRNKALVMFLKNKKDALVKANSLFGWELVTRMVYDQAPFYALLPLFINPGKSEDFRESVNSKL